MPLLVPVITILMLLMIAPCIINCLTRLVSSQVNKLQHAVPVQQGYIKLQPTTQMDTHPQMDTAIRTLRLETSKRGRPNAPHHPSSAESGQRDLDTPNPKEMGLPSLKEGILDSQNRKKESKMAVTQQQQQQRQRKEKPAKMEQKKIQGPE